MFAHITGLQCWQSQHTAETCKDALGDNLSGGLLVVADGIGTTLFSNIWARHLVAQFLETPLLSNDPFEVEWWLRLCQKRYQEKLSLLENMPWNVVQKAQSEGSLATLAAVRVTHCETYSATVDLLACGHNCILIKKAATDQVISFPIAAAADFNLPPTYLPSRLDLFHRHFHRLAMKQMELGAGDILLLATDAVAHWIMSAGGGQYASPSVAFAMVAHQTPDTWPSFIAECRASKGLVDDDSTVLVLTLSAKMHAGAQELGVIPAHQRDVRLQRKQTFRQVVHTQNKELAAIFFGDGTDLTLEGIVFPDEQLQQARMIADAIADILQVVRREANSPYAATKIQPIWQKYAPILEEEPCTIPLKKVLTRLGISFEPRGWNAFSSSGQWPRLSSGEHRRSGALTITEKHPEQLRLERELAQALRSNNEYALRTVYSAVQRSPFASQILGSLRNNQQRQLSQHQNGYTSRAVAFPGPVHKLPHVSETWFYKACQVKRAYLLHWAFQKLSDIELEQATLDELVNVDLVRTHIEQANRDGASPPLLPEMLLPETMQSFQRDRMVQYHSLLLENELTDRDIQQLLLIFLSRQLFDEYLLREKSLQPQEWLREQYGNDIRIFRACLLAACPWVATLYWWGG